MAVTVAKSNVEKRRPVMENTAAVVVSALARLLGEPIAGFEELAPRNEVE